MTQIKINLNVAKLLLNNLEETMNNYVNEFENSRREFNCVEQWKAIKKYPNYGASNKGRIKNLKTGRILKQNVFGKYLHISLMNEGAIKTFRVHRLIANTFLPNPEKKKCVDHINRDCYDNRLENLRFATHTENSQNKKICKNNKSGFIGVSYLKDGNKYRARITHNNSLIHLGCYSTAEEASMAYVEKAKILFGEFFNDS